jgi:hypothetical protein
MLRAHLRKPGLRAFHEGRVLAGRHLPTPSTCRWQDIEYIAAAKCLVYAMLIG